MASHSATTEGKDEAKDELEESTLSAQLAALRRRVAKNDCEFFMYEPYLPFQSGAANMAAFTPLALGHGWTQDAIDKVSDSVHHDQVPGSKYAQPWQGGSMLQPLAAGLHGWAVQLHAQWWPGWQRHD